jgi:hypothetical protein
MKSDQPQFAVCVCNEGYPASLELRKIYRIMHDTESEQIGCVRVIDESGESYLYPADWFLPLEPSQLLRSRLESLVAG